MAAWRVARREAGRASSRKNIIIGQKLRASKVPLAKGLRKVVLVHVLDPATRRTQYLVEHVPRTVYSAPAILDYFKNIPPYKQRDDNGTTYGKQIHAALQLLAETKSLVCLAPVVEYKGRPYGTRMLELVTEREAHLREAQRSSAIVVFVNDGMKSDHQYTADTPVVDGVVDPVLLVRAEDKVLGPVLGLLKQASMFTHLHNANRKHEVVENLSERCLTSTPEQKAAFVQRVRTWLHDRISRGLYLRGDAVKISTFSR